MFNTVLRLAAVIAILSASSVVQAQEGQSPSAPTQASSPAPSTAPPAATEAVTAPPAAATSPAATASPSVAAPPAASEQTAEQSGKQARSAAIPHELSPWSMFMAADILV